MSGAIKLFCGTASKIVHYMAAFANRAQDIVVVISLTKGSDTNLFQIFGPK
jgi:hypothetical protein